MPGLRPATRYFQERGNHDKVFSARYNIHVFGVCARIKKKIDAFLRINERDRGHRNNLLFYVMMVATSLALRTPKPRHDKIATLDVDKKLDEGLLKEALDFVRPIYDKHGADDKAAKGTEMVSEIKAELRKGSGVNKTLITSCYVLFGRGITYRIVRLAPCPLGGDSRIVSTFGANSACITWQQSGILWSGPG